MLLLVCLEVTTPIFDFVQFFLMIVIMIFNGLFIALIDDHGATVHIIFLHLVIFFISVMDLSNPKARKNIYTSGCH